MVPVADLPADVGALDLVARPVEPARVEVAARAAEVNRFGSWSWRSVVISKAPVGKLPLTFVLVKLLSALHALVAARAVLVHLACGKELAAAVARIRVQRDAAIGAPPLTGHALVCLLHLVGARVAVSVEVRDRQPNGCHVSSHSRS